MQIDEGRLKQQLRDCIALNERVGRCKFEGEVGSCYDCSWPHALEFVIGAELYEQWHDEIMAELQPKIDELPPRAWTIMAASVGMLDASEAVEVSVQ